jgi:cytochrome P450
MSAMCTLTLLRDPKQAALLRERPELIPSAVEEFPRHLTIIHLGLARSAKEPVEIAGTSMAAGDAVICMLSTANRDEEVFGSEGCAAPSRLDLARDARRHLAFGFGVHQCLGQPLARAELHIILETLLLGCPNCGSPCRRRSSSSAPRALCTG